jgi:hypothetical protein
MTRFEYLQRRFEFCVRGDRLHQSKLTEQDVRQIRELHAFKQAEIKRLNESLGIEAIADKFEVHPRTIEKVLTFETWKHVT